MLNVDDANLHTNITREKRNRSKILCVSLHKNFRYYHHYRSYMYQIYNVSWERLDKRLRIYLANPSIKNFDKKIRNYEAKDLASNVIYCDLNYTKST